MVDPELDPTRAVGHVLHTSAHAAANTMLIHGVYKPLMHHHRGSIAYQCLPMQNLKSNCLRMPTIAYQCLQGASELASHQDHGKEPRSLNSAMYGRTLYHHRHLVAAHSTLEQTLPYHCLLMPTNCLPIAYPLPTNCLPLPTNCS